MRQLLLVMTVLAMCASASAQNANGIAFWQCPPMLENLYIRVVNSRYMVSLYVVAGQRTTKELSGMTIEPTDIKVCADGRECVTAKGSVHFVRFERGKITGRFTVSLPNGETVANNFEARLTPRSNKTTCE